MFIKLKDLAKTRIKLSTILSYHKADAPKILYIETKTTAGPYHYLNEEDLAYDMAALDSILEML